VIETRKDLISKISKVEADLTVFKATKNQTESEAFQNLLTSVKQISERVDTTEKIEVESGTHNLTLLDCSK
jgi:hypothetical protein